MNLEKHHASLGDGHFHLVGSTVCEVEYVENNYTPQNPQPFYSTDDESVHMVDVSIRLFLQQQKAVEICWNCINGYWDGDFFSYGLKVKFAHSTHTARQYSWPVSAGTFWQDVVGQTITEVNVYSAKTTVESPQTKVQMDFSYPQSIALVFTNRVEIVIGVVQFQQGHRFTQVQGISHLLVTKKNPV